MKMNKIAIALAVSIFSVAPSAFAIDQHGNGVNSSSVNSSNHENMRSSYEHSDSGKSRAEWSKGRVIKKGESVQCWNKNLMRGGVDSNC